VQHPFHGASAFNLDLNSVFGLCRSYEPVLADGQFFSHSTAAALHGVPLPETIGLSPIHIAAFDRTPPRRSGVIGHATSVFAVDLLAGFPVVAAPDAWCQLAGQLNREDLVAAGDFLISGVRRARGARSAPLCSLEQLRRAVAQHRGCRGARSLQWALPRLRTGVDSRPESLLRLLLVAAGIAEPLVGFPVEVDRGRSTLHPDLALPGVRVAFEYEGDGHRVSRSQFHSDIARRERFEAAGWRVVRVTADGLFVHPSELIDRVHDVLGLRARWR
jgi:hypothetical protein